MAERAVDYSARPAVRRKSLTNCGVLKRRRKPGECAPRWAAIRNQCLECVSWQWGEVELCTDPECWLYPWRFGRGHPRDIETSIDDIRTREQGRHRASFSRQE